MITFLLMIKKYFKLNTRFPYEKFNFMFLLRFIINKYYNYIGRHFFYKLNNYTSLNFNETKLNMYLN